MYEASARAFVTAWKEHGRRDLAKVAAGLIHEIVTRPDVDAIAFVPGDRDRSLQRGHVPAAVLAAELAVLWSIPPNDALTRRPGIGRQRTLPRADRRKNVAQAFTVREQVPPRICLVDDVYTTGSTAAACAAALRRAGARYVDVVCLARAVR